MKKVCLVVSNPFTNDVRVYKEAETLSSNNLEVVVYATNPQKKLPEKEILNQFTVKRLPVETYKLRLKPHKLITEFIPTLLQLREEKAQVYHANDLDTLMIAYLSCLRRAAKLIYDSHELWPDRREIFDNANIWTKLVFKFMLLQEKMLISRADLVITVNESIASFLKKYYRINKPEVVKNCPNSSSLTRKRIFTKKFNFKNKKIVLFQGNITKERGLIELVESARWFNDHIVLVLMGNGELVDRLKKMVKLKLLDERVYFQESVSLEDLPNYTSSSDVGVIPYLNLSLNHYFCLPNKFFDYLHAGLPVAASDFPEMSRIIREEKIGVTFDPANPKDIADKINSVFVNQQGYEEMKKQAFKAAAKYTWESESKKLLKVYEKVLKP